MNAKAGDPHQPHGPANPSSPVKPEGDETPEAPPLSILLLDDDSDFREYMSALLESDGHEVRAVGTPEEFFCELEAHEPDLVLLDMKMGRARGEDVLARIRKTDEQARRRVEPGQRSEGGQKPTRRVCVIIITGYPSLDSMRETFKQDVIDYLAKPFTHGELRRILAQAAETHGLGRRPQDRLRRELGRQIRLARTERGWMLRDLSEASGVSVSQLSAIERGAHLPSLESLLAIADALDRTSSDWLAAAGF